MVDKVWEGIPAALDLPQDEQDHEKTSGINDAAQQTPDCLTNSQDSNTSLSAEDEYVYPEGGLRAWLAVFGSWCAMFASLGIANTLASFQAYISQNQLSSYTPDQIGWVFSIYTFLSFACGIYIGPLFDVYGPLFLTIPGGICVVLSMLLLGVCTGRVFFRSLETAG